MIHTQLKKRKSGGFTLTELLVVIVIIAILAALSVIGTSSFKKQAAASKDATTLRNIWTSIMVYTSEANDTMPGPLDSGQRPAFNSEVVPGAAPTFHRLADFLAPGFGYTDAKKDDIIMPMVASWQKTKEQQTAPSFILQHKLPVGETTAVKSPWGKTPASGVPAADRIPMKYSAVMAQPKATRLWCMVEVDQKNPAAAGAGWLSETPEEMVHGSYRLAMYFDGSSGKVDINNEKK